MNKKAVSLLSGGLDSTLATCILKEQGIEIEAINFQTMFGCCKDDAREVATRLGVGFTLLKVGDDYLDMIKNPKYGYGRAINPCVDCRSYMFTMAKKWMDQMGASFMISGEVLNQRPMSQKMRDFELIEAECGLEGRILRPLSAKRLPETEPEKAGIVDRSKLFGIEGRSRAELLKLAAKYGIENPPSASSGCALTEKPFAEKVRDVFENRPDYKRWEFEVLKTGRHFRLSSEAKVILGRNENENQYLISLHPEGTWLLEPEQFIGPYALVVGTASDEDLGMAGAIMLRYSQNPRPQSGVVRAVQNENAKTIRVPHGASEELINSLRIA
ncbi:MAG: 7-cyano-7-deazaguanine synthase [Candidatus Omnitrophota bacterium]|nr:7-cyano-7-deazaguanine synthase [Candidatus Omnitrophota bacterium]